MQEPIYIRKIAVLGAGVMGAQIAAHMVNSGFQTVLFDLASPTGGINALVIKSIQHLKKMKPSPLAISETAEKIQACNYEEDLSELSNCDLIIEAIGERLEWKQDLYRRIAPHLSPRAVIASNTSGLSINTLANELPESHRPQFCGIHFFNPPRYMHLAELIPSETTSPVLLDFLETWLTRYIGKGVVRAKDTPNFIANRVGVFSLLATMHYANVYQLGFDEVDALTGTLLGRPKSATFRTMDVVGLDTMGHVVSTMNAELQVDPWLEQYTLPEWLTELISRGHLGQKSGQGIYRKKGKVIDVYDVALGDYRLSDKGVNPDVLKIMKRTNPTERMQGLLNSMDPQAQFLVAYFKSLFHYCAYHLQSIAHTVQDVDLALCWGFGWQSGPFETWQAIGYSLMQQTIEQSIQSGQALCSAALPNWINHIQAFYADGAAYNPSTQRFEGASALPVYRRQYGSPRAIKPNTASQRTIFENDGVLMWEMKDGTAVVQFKTKSNTIGQSVLEGLEQAIDQAERANLGLILYQEDAGNFSSGADLRQVYELMQRGDYTTLEGMVKAIQRVSMRLKYTPIPTVAALRGRALGGGCELMMHCDATVAAFESYPGLVELGVGLIPAGAGSTAFAKRAAMKARGGDLMPYIRSYFEQIATATVSGSATDAMKRGFLKKEDQWVMHLDEVLHAACAKLTAMQEMNYRPPLPARFAVAGREGKAQLQVGIVNWLEGGFISQHDYVLATTLAHVLCGGDVNEGTMVDDAWMLALEREAFMNLAKTPETQARIQYLLETGKPLRN